MIRILTLVILFFLSFIGHSFASKFISFLPDYYSWPVKMSYSIDDPDGGAAERADKYLERKELFFSSSVTEIYRLGENKPRLIYWFDVKRDFLDEPVSAYLREYELIDGRYELFNEDYIQIKPEASK